ncbi:hypothetical protein B0H17DRAFT_1132038 [Mycena rosella]|uniref:Uncharacterized protein n=1 Tax=Mycena rosella TaxID=1033263 RepID=A0AAD7GK00_MYCRO|nr:hypothetical protein B0H17DRAFT_1132038 [Mycena rosella]
MKLLTAVLLNVLAVHGQPVVLSNEMRQARSNENARHQNWIRPVPVPVRLHPCTRVTGAYSMLIFEGRKIALGDGPYAKLGQQAAENLGNALGSPQLATILGELANAPSVTGDILSPGKILPGLNLTDSLEKQGVQAAGIIVEGVADPLLGPELGHVVGSVGGVVGGGIGAVADVVAGALQANT